MSAKATAWVWEHSLSRGLDRLVLLAIADDMSHRANVVGVSLEQLASKAFMAKSTVQCCIKHLQDAGELEIRLHGCGRTKVTEYGLPGVDKGTGGGTFSPKERTAKVVAPVPLPSASPPQASKEVLFLSPPQQGSMFLDPLEPSVLKGADAPQNGHASVTVQSLVTFYVDTCNSYGWDPLRDWCNQISKQIRKVWNEKPEEIIRGALRIAADERKSPSALPHVIADIEAGRNGNGQSA